MRSQLVYAANVQMPNRYLMAMVAMLAVRKLHIASTRTQDTANHVFAELAAGRALDVTMPELKPLAPLDPVLVSVGA